MATLPELSVELLARMLESMSEEAVLAYFGSVQTHLAGLWSRMDDEERQMFVENLDENIQAAAILALLPDREEEIRRHIPSVGERWEQIQTLRDSFSSSGD